MKEVVSVKNMRLSDEYTIENFVSSEELMLRAGKGIYSSVEWHGKILVACGTGNNGGDGYVLAELLKDNGYNVAIMCLDERFSKDGEFFFKRCLDKKVPYSIYKNEDLSSYDIIVDCLLGTGFKGSLEGKARTFAQAINKSDAFVVSADINSGLNGDTGLGDVIVKSDLTVSIGSLKTGHYLGKAKDYIKKLVNVDIGIKLQNKPYHIFEKKDAKSLLSPRQNYSNKGSYGYVTLIGGSFEYSGAIKLANLATSAVRSGAGVVRLALPKSICFSVMPYIVESTLFPLSEVDGSITFNSKEIDEATKNVSCVAIGMGMGQRGDNKELIEYLLRTKELTLIIDADGINTLAKMDISVLKDTKCKVILTPHLKELERLTNIDKNELEEDLINYSIDYARNTGTILLVKGPTTIVTDGERVILVNRGCAGMATGGSGDVLSGILAGLCAERGADLLEKVSLGAFVNGFAGEIAQEELSDISMSAKDTAMCVAKAISRLRK